jgi:non-canonical purine NTP pyrophosphatase (RdgB/HAM1 family)
MRLLFVTTNTEKLKEARLALAPYGHQVESIDYDFIEPANGAIESIAKEKLSQLGPYVTAEMPVIVDDSGLYLVAYEGFPGILTKRIFQQIGYKGIKKLLVDEDRRAYFHGVIAFMWKGEVKTFHGTMHGKIIDEIPFDLPEELQYPFDPIFIPEGSKSTMSQLSTEEKLCYSYRRKALDQLGAWLKEEGYE